MKLFSVNDLRKLFGRVNVKAELQAVLDHSKPVMQTLVAQYVGRIDDQLPLSMAKTAVADKITQAIDVAIGHNPALAPVRSSWTDTPGQSPRFYVPDTLSTAAFKQGIINLVNEKIDGARL